MPFCYKHPGYWQVIKAESKKNGDMVNSRKIFDDSEAAHPIEEDEFIKIENIKGKLVLIGAEDDALWDTAKYIRRAEKRLSEKAAFLQCGIFRVQARNALRFSRKFAEKHFTDRRGIVFKTCL